MKKTARFEKDHFRRAGGGFEIERFARLVGRTGVEKVELREKSGVSFVFDDANGGSAGMIGIDERRFGGSAHPLFMRSRSAKQPFLFGEAVDTKKQRLSGVSLFRSGDFERIAREKPRRRIRLYQVEFFGIQER